MAWHFRRRRRIGLPITLSVSLIGLNLTLMVLWIVLFAQFHYWSVLTIGTVVFSLILVGLSVYMVLTIKEVRLNQRQANFVDSVTHELKSPIASLRLYLDTLQMRSLDPVRREEFYNVMTNELQRLDALINQLLQVGRLDAIGRESEPQNVDLVGLLRQCGSEAAARNHRQTEEIFTFDAEEAHVFARRIVLEMIFRNLLDNSVKYGGDPPRVVVEVRANGRGSVLTRIIDNGEGVPLEARRKVFQMFFRGGSELERRQKGTGLGLYIAKNLVRSLKGTITVSNRRDGPGSVFEVALPAADGFAAMKDKDEG